MITKQQALEFIYDLSQKREVCIDTKKGFIGTDPFVYDDNRTDMYLELGYDYSSHSTENSLEAIVTQFIKDFINTGLLKVNFPIPVDVDMLEVGQTYKVEFLDFTGVSVSFTEKLLSITEEGKTVFNFSNGYCTKYIDIKEIYKVNE